MSDILHFIEVFSIVRAEELHHGGTNL
jgi:hypothetical protein